MLCIKTLEWKIAHIPRSLPLVTSHEAEYTSTNIFLRIETDDAIGYGSAAPTDVTGETEQTVCATLESLRDMLHGKTFTHAFDVLGRMQEAIAGHPSAKAALDMALFDCLARLEGKPLFRLFGAQRDRLPLFVTIPLVDKDISVDIANRLIAGGFGHLKMKVGNNYREDLGRIEAVRRQHTQAVIAADANQGYSRTQAHDFCLAAEKLGVTFVEQPIAKEDTKGMRALVELHILPIVADEALLTFEDAAALEQNPYANGVTLKLMKHGGITPNRSISAACERAGCFTLQGCMGESQLSIAAGLHCALADPNSTHVDLDSFLNLAADPCSGLRIENGTLIAPAKPGLGIDVHWDDF
ncbi:MAG: dipeptide epimerase [Candidatus Peribacteraceae bacterium]|nr:dipeptide epimerase [Candidatus Peribacteraceae bacterium]